ncbi:MULTISPECIES: type IV pilin protein [Ralstonia]|uniref:Type IV pilus assembly protein PilE n=1 Tax=Ralstonia holmesii TaxID=3058602 RepID=A0ABC8QAE6_9RALS|nr:MULTISPECIES: prepilin-type N-terminal cleavage/methylation domain-containing protein [unclassified Ralstonia]CAJ0787307.1 hypothetical protein LMG18096_01945 [Ralstonia sp. LMG 32967]CAJ0808142.1 hypothetical protein LMG18093_00449 [Ralstonia sp. LMG 32967]
MRCRHAAFTLVELTIALAIAALLTSTAIQTWSRHHERAQRAAVQAALVSTMVEWERQYARTGDSSASASVPNHISGYHLITNPCEDRALVHCVEVVAQPVHPGTGCGSLILRSTGERFTQIGNARQPASRACWP